MDQRGGAQAGVPGIDARNRLLERPPNLGPLELGLDAVGDSGADLVLEIEDVAQRSAQS